MEASSAVEGVATLRGYRYFKLGPNAAAPPGWLPKNSDTSGVEIRAKLPTSSEHACLIILVD